MKETDAFCPPIPGRCGSGTCTGLAQKTTHPTRESGLLAGSGRSHHKADSKGGDTGRRSGVPPGGGSRGGSIRPSEGEGRGVPGEQLKSLAQENGAVSQRASQVVGTPSPKCAGEETHMVTVTDCHHPGLI